MGSSTSSFVAEAVWGETISVNATGTLTIQAVPPLNKDILVLGLNKIPISQTCRP